MSDIVAVLVVPAVGDPGRLLRGGIALARPPMFVRERTDPVCSECGAVARWSSAPTEQTSSCWVCSVEWRHNGITLTGWTNWMATSARRDGYELALPLWWEGALVPEGWDRARRVANDSPTMPDYSSLRAFTATPESCGWLADALVTMDLASRVVRLARVDGRLVEVAGSNGASHARPESGAGHV